MTASVPPPPGPVAPGAQPAPPAQGSTQGSTRSAVWVTALLLAVTVALGWLIDQRPAEPAPRAATGELGDVLRVGDVLVAVESVRQVDVVVEPSSWGDDRTYETSGSWLVVRLAYQGATAPATYGTIQWRDELGRTFDVDLRPSSGGVVAQPGQWIVDDVVLEVAPGPMGAGEVLVSPSSTLSGVPYRIGVVSVPADQIQRPGEPLELIDSVWVENDA